MFKNKSIFIIQLLALFGIAILGLNTNQNVASSSAVFYPNDAEHHCGSLAFTAGPSMLVSTVSELQSAVNNATPNLTILIADGIYNLNGVYLRIDEANIALRSASGNREAVILDGNYQTTEIIQIVRSNVIIADITLREAYYHPIHVMSTDAGGDVLNTLIYNVHIIDPGEQAIKINKAGDNVYPDNGVIACSHIELTDTGRPFIRNNCYTGGIDAHQARNWHVRDNLIEGFWCDNGLSEHAVHFWRGSRDTLVERNNLIDNARGVGFGLTTSGSGRTYADNVCPAAGNGYVDHFGGTVRNNFISADDTTLFNSQFGFDCGICFWNACGAKAHHNTVASTQAPFSSIEWRFDHTEAEIYNNLVTHQLRDRGGEASVSGNLVNQPLSIFVDIATGNLHLNASATNVIDQASVLAGMNDDFDGHNRPAGAAPDVGADEFSSVFTTPVPTPTIEVNAQLFLPLTQR